MRAMAAALLLCAVVAQSPPQISNLDRGISLDMLKQVKRDLKDNYYDPAFRGMDVEKTFADAETRLRAAGSVSEATAVIVDVLARLNDSHTMFVPPQRAARVDYGWRAGMVGDTAYVVRVDAGSDAGRKGLAPGDRILAWNRFEPTRDNILQIRYLYDFVRPQTLQRLIVRKPDGSERSIDVESAVSVHTSQQIEDLFDDIVASMRSMDTDRDKAAGDVLVWKLAGFGDPKAIDRVLKKSKDAKALILDLRGNGGGAVDALKDLVSRLFDRDVTIGTVKTRKGDEPLVAKGRKDAYTGKLVVLIDGASASAAEIAARVVQLQGRAQVIGDRSMGAVMTSRIFPHVAGAGSVTFYATSITVGDLRMSDGASLEKVGVTPDETVLPTAADLAASRDPVLARAITLLGGTMTPEQAGSFYR